MKKLKGKSKTGFTLLEVLLATVIMVIASTMIMQGFIAVMVLGANNRSLAKSGDYNYRMALNQTLIEHATAANQESSIESLNDGIYSTVSAHRISGTGVGIPSDSELSMIVDVSAFTNSDAAYTYNVAGDDIDSAGVSNNRFAFFYDFGDMMNRSGGHIMRYGYTVDPSEGYAHIDENHGNYNTPIYDNRGNVVAYGWYGWYCFNTDHDGSTCRSVPYTSTRLVPSTPSST